MTRDEFQKWVAEARPGSKVEYHAGFLAKDRVNTHNGQLAECVYVGGLAMRLWRDGLIDLFQKKLRDNYYIYYAVKRLNKEPRPEPKRSNNVLGLRPHHKTYNRRPVPNGMEMSLV